MLIEKLLLSKLLRYSPRILVSSDASRIVTPLRFRASSSRSPIDCILVCLKGILCKTSSQVPIVRSFLLLGAYRWKWEVVYSASLVR